jgi:dihydroorotate dehydrogenase electron transfer subunit
MVPGPPAGAAAGLAAFDGRPCEVAENRRSGGYRLLSLRDRAGTEPLPGQFYVLTAGPGGGEAGAFPPRPLPIAAFAPGPGGIRLEFLVGNGGDGDRISDLAAGDRVWVTGPLGEPFAAPRELSPGAAGAVLVGAGLGIAPLALLRRRLGERGVPLRVLIGFRSEVDSGGLELFCGSGAELCPEVRLASEDGHRGHRGPVTDLLAVLLEGDDASSAVVYASGPPPILEVVGALSAGRGVTCELVPESPAVPIRSP